MGKNLHHGQAGPWPAVLCRQEICGNVRFGSEGNHDTSEDAVKALEGLKGMSKNGLRYPIASYSLTSDILDGLPKHYLEF